MSEVQNEQQDGQQQTQDAAGQATDQAGQAVEGVQDAVGGLTGDQEQGGEGGLGGMIGQTQGAAGQATGQVGQLADQAKDTVGGLTGGLLGGLGGGQQQGSGQSGEQEMDDYSYSDSDAETVVNDKTPRVFSGNCSTWISSLLRRAIRLPWSPVTPASTTVRNKNPHTSRRTRNLTAEAVDSWPRPYVDQARGRASRCSGCPITWFTGFRIAA